MPRRSARIQNRILKTKDLAETKSEQITIQNNTSKSEIFAAKTLPKNYSPIHISALPELQQKKKAETGTTKSIPNNDVLPELEFSSTLYFIKATNPLYLPPYKRFIKIIKKMQSVDEVNQYIETQGYGLTNSYKTLFENALNFLDQCLVHPTQAMSRAFEEIQTLSKLEQPKKIIKQLIDKFFVLYELALAQEIDPALKKQNLLLIAKHIEFNIAKLCRLEKRKFEKVAAGALDAHTELYFDDCFSIAVTTEEECIKQEVTNELYKIQVGTIIPNSTVEIETNLYKSSAVYAHVIGNLYENYTVAEISAYLAEVKNISDLTEKKFVKNKEALEKKLNQTTMQQPNFSSDTAQKKSTIKRKAPENSKKPSTKRSKTKLNSPNVWFNDCVNLDDETDIETSTNYMAKLRAKLVEGLRNQSIFFVPPKAQIQTKEQIRQVYSKKLSRSDQEATPIADTTHKPRTNPK